MKKQEASSLSYLTREGFRNFWANRTMSLASVAVLLFCLILIGSASMLYVNIEAMLENIGEQNVVMVYTDENLSEEDTKKVGTDLQQTQNIKSVKFISQAEGWSDFISDIGGDADLFAAIEKNPLPNAYEVTVLDLELFVQTVEQIKKINNVYNVRDSSELATQLASIRKTVTYVSAALVVVLLFVSLFIITNTIRITMYERRLEISIMKSVGATKNFIRWPFMIEGVIIGTLAGVFAVGAVGLLYTALVNAVPMDTLGMLGLELLPFGGYWWKLFLAFLAIGVGTGMFGSLISMHKYLKEQEVTSDETEIETV